MFLFYATYVWNISPDTLASFLISYFIKILDIYTHIYLQVLILSEVLIVIWMFWRYIMYFLKNLYLLKYSWVILLPSSYFIFHHLNRKAADISVYLKYWERIHFFLVDWSNFLEFLTKTPNMVYLLQRISCSYKEHKGLCTTRAYSPIKGYCT